ncbi:PEP-CTERM sorting domain-containing protein [Crocosphaera sp. XPORK-15E]|uniref:PEP-CTERM sorting domain-containing protein n=1 Tax=Crocosphaera sp. XPORK-15E TaxID=3110247 RepID=UPI002B2047E0|nr:PEP-CTERM sorting domain-containing protein [Crocosphaera sp. XPORK-15E]MEA5535752.1 PEP-CTERM sorting domain-containing protein [Crocosphaera sp. XPORK-15E]
MKHLKSTLASGLTAFGLLAGMGAISAPAQAALIPGVTYNCPDGSTFGNCLLSDLVNGGSIQVGDKLFSEWTLLGLTPTNVDAGNIIIEGIDPFTDEPGPGLKYTFANNELSLTGPGTEQIFFGYKVDVLDPNKFIKDNSLGFLATATGSNSSAEVHEFVFEDAARSIAALGTHNLPGLTNEKDVLFVVDNDQVTEDSPTDFIDFTDNYKTLYITKEFSVDVSGAAGTASITEVTQNFSQTSVPEPSTVLGLVALGGLGLASKGKKQK